MDYKIQIVETDAQPVLSIRTRSSVADLPKRIGSSYQAILEYMTPLGIQASGMPFVAYYNLDMEDLDVEIGFPVSEIVDGQGDIQCSEIPSGKKITCMHQGSYQELPETYHAIIDHIGTKKLEPSGVVYEHYFNAPDKVPEEELLTEVVFLLND
ncbi:GyrI-like domain-containing protein [Clostridia bacterium]|nr:GyrI-like domain-containing protein [Clostridia bacterium]